MEEQDEMLAQREAERMPVTPWEDRIGRLPNRTIDGPERRDLLAPAQAELLRRAADGGAVQVLARPGPRPRSLPAASGELWEPSSILGIAFVVVVMLTVAGVFASTLLTAIYLMHS
jgi:hypothetical protein